MTTQPEPTETTARDALAELLAQMLHGSADWAEPEVLQSVRAVWRGWAATLLSPEHAPTVIAALVEAGRLPDAETLSDLYRDASIRLDEQRRMTDKAEAALADAKARLAAPRHCRACGRDVTVEP